MNSRGVLYTVLVSTFVVRWRRCSVLWWIFHRGRTLSTAASWSRCKIQSSACLGWMGGISMLTIDSSTCSSSTILSRWFPALIRCSKIYMKTTSSLTSQISSPGHQDRKGSISWCSGSSIFMNRISLSSRSWTLRRLVNWWHCEA